MHEKTVSNILCLMALLVANSALAQKADELLVLKDLKSGQGMTEYIIIVALIAIAAIGVFSMFGDVVKNQTAAMAKELSGTSGQEASDKSRTQSNKAVEKANKKNDLQNFTGQQ